MSKLIAGAYASIAKGFVKAAENTVEQVGGNALQIFLKSPRGGGVCKLTDAEASDYKKYAQTQGLFTVAHCSYLLNFAKDLTDKPWTLTNLIDDLNNLERLGGVGVVLHIGKSLGLPRAVGLEFVIQNIGSVLTQTKNLKAAIILENTAGQGTELGFTFDELAVIYRGLKKHKRVKFCLDTCHAFAAGYDLRSLAGVKKTFAEFDQKLGLKNLACIHFNDSKSKYESRVDRHADLGEGEIGLSGLRAIAKLAASKKIPLILETPELATSYAEQLKQVKNWI
jgi:deoxyribonuclease-4